MRVTLLQERPEKVLITDLREAEGLGLIPNAAVLVLMQGDALNVDIVNLPCNADRFAI